MDKQSLKKGTRIYYTGDMANEEGFGVITHRSNGRFGSFVTLKMDDGRLFESLSATQFSDVYEGHCGTRFVTATAYKAWAFRNNKAFEKMQEDAVRQAEKRGESDENPKSKRDFRAELREQKSLLYSRIPAK